LKKIFFKKRIQTLDTGVPVSFVDHLLQEDQYVHTLSSSTTHFLFSVLEYLTDYILDLVDTKANTGRMQMTPQDVERAVDSNAEPHRQVKDTAGVGRAPEDAEFPEWRW
uniref:Histone H2A n=1 Tax=Sus scrofa TaxID=9823 RepID=A0A8D1CM12_PIG